MSSPLVYLKPNLVIEPLVARWYAWSHLISPATAAMNICGRHLKIMDSYIQAPKVHAAAVKNPKMRGGPFIDYGGQKVEEIKRLRNDTLQRQHALITFAEGVKTLNEMLNANAKGHSLEPLYSKVPKALKGYVELVYDLNNNPSFRFFEPLLYKSQYYDASFQSIALWLTHNDQRPFVLSTPRLDGENVLHLPIPFNHACIDALAAMKRTSRPLQEIMDLFPLESEEDKKLFASFFTEEPSAAYKKYDGKHIRMRYFGHACILIETGNISILVDPIISYYGYQSDTARYSDSDLPDVIDYVLITHNHQDHILFETLLPLRHKIKHIVVPKSSGGTLQDPSLKLMFNRIGFGNVSELGEMETLPLQDLELTGIPFIGEHSDLNIQAKICYHLRLNSLSMIFMADSCNIEPDLYAHVHREIGDVDVVFLGMECDGAPLSWLYGPLLPEELARDKDNSRRLAGSNYEKGKAIVDILKPRELYVYAMGMEPWLEFISSIKYTEQSNPIIASNRLVEECRRLNITAERLYGEKEIFY